MMIEFVKLRERMSWSVRSRVNVRCWLMLNCCCGLLIFPLISFMACCMLTGSVFRLLESWYKWMFLIVCGFASLGFGAVETKAPMGKGFGSFNWGVVDRICGAYW